MMIDYNAPVFSKRCPATYSSLFFLLITNKTQLIDPGVYRVVFMERHNPYPWGLSYRPS